MLGKGGIQGKEDQLGGCSSYSGKRRQWSERGRSCGGGQEGQLGLVRIMSPGLGEEGTWKG